MPVPPGSGNFKLQKTIFSLPRDVACILLRVGVTGFTHHIAAMLEGNTSDILEIKKEADKYILICQTTGKDTLHIFDGNTSRQERREISSAGIHEIEWK